MNQKLVNPELGFNKKEEFLEVVKKYNPDEFTINRPSTFDGEGFLE